MAHARYCTALILIVCNKRTSVLTRGTANYPKQQTYQEELDKRIAAKHVAEAKQRGIPLWMLTGFPVLSNEPDQDDPIDFQ